MSSSWPRYDSTESVVAFGCIHIYSSIYENTSQKHCSATLGSRRHKNSIPVVLCCLVVHVMVRLDRAVRDRYLSQNSHRLSYHSTPFFSLLDIAIRCSRSFFYYWVVHICHDLFAALEGARGVLMLSACRSVS